MDGKLQQVAPGVHRVTDALANWYAVGLEDDRVVLVDRGWPQSRDALSAGLRDPGTRAPGMLLELWRPAALRLVAESIERGVLSPRSVAAPAVLDRAFKGSTVPMPTPGHTEGHTAYWLPERGVVFSGDALVTLEMLTGRRGPRMHPAPFQADVRRARQSLAVFASIDADVLLPGHGDAFSGPVAADAAEARGR